MRPAKRQIIFPMLHLGLALFAGTTVLAPEKIIAQTNSSETSARSVVKITAKKAGGASVGSGFVWSQPTYVVTALHVVAGAQNLEVYSESQKNGASAAIAAVHLESDLALLQLKSDLKLTPLQHAGTPPKLGEEHFIWGYPRDVATMQGDDLRFSRSLEQAPTLKNIFKSAAQFESVIGAQSYPKLEAKILRVSSIIQPGHSGAPIFDKAGLVVGIGDGGLHQGAARINWAIPAMTYLPMLAASKDAIPAESSKQAALMSTPATDPVETKIPFSSSGSDQAQQQTEILRWSWSAPLADLLATLAAEELQEFQEWTATAEENFKQTIIDIYEDYETGATIPVPRGLALSYDPQERLLEAWSDNQRVQMIVAVMDNDTWEEGVAAKQRFENYLASLAAWEKGEEEQPVYDAEEAYWYHDYCRRAVEDDEAQTEMELCAKLIIDANEFLGVAVIVREAEAFSPEDSSYFYAMMACVKLTDFAIE